MENPSLRSSSLAHAPGHAHSQTLKHNDVKHKASNSIDVSIAWSKMKRELEGRALLKSRALLRWAPATQATSYREENTKMHCALNSTATANANLKIVKFLRSKKDANGINQTIN